MADRISGSTINDIDPQVEREQCFSLEGKERISNTAKNCADRVWLRRYNERWKLKTAAALRKEKKQKKRAVTSKQAEDNHFIPKSFIKRYWSEGQYVYRNVKTPEELEKKRGLLLVVGGLEKTSTLTT